MLRMSRWKEGAVGAVGTGAEGGQQAVGSCYGSARRTFDASLEACVEGVHDGVFELGIVLALGDEG